MEPISFMFGVLKQIKKIGLIFETRSFIRGLIAGSKDTDVPWC